MKKMAIAIIGLLAAGTAEAQTSASHPTPAEVKITAAERALARNSQSYQAYNELAMALAKRARETADPKYYRRAEEALAKSFELKPGNFEGRKARVWVLLGKHEFAAALEIAQQLNRQAPDDVLVYGLLTDAHVNLGNYKEAEEAAQWMLDLRPGEVPALTRAAYLRELFGDIEGALDLMHTAYQQTRSSESEDRAWLLVEMARLHRATGKLELAAKAATMALETFPRYHYALAELARVRLAEKRFREAVTLLEERYRAAPHPENLFDLAEAFARAGRKAEADRAFAAFDKAARAEMVSLDNANRELIFYYADYAAKPAEALRIARREAERRRDVHTLDALAWALFRNGQFAEARKHLDAALAVGIRDAKMLYHAGAIAAKLNDRAAARKFFQMSLEANPRSEVALAARTALARRS